MYASDSAARVAVAGHQRLVLQAARHGALRDAHDYLVRVSAAHDDRCVVPKMLMGLVMQLSEARLALLRH